MLIRTTGALGKVAAAGPKLGPRLQAVAAASSAAARSRRDRGTTIEGYFRRSRKTGAGAQAPAPVGRERWKDLETYAHRDLELARDLVAVHARRLAEVRSEVPVAGRVARARPLDRRLREGIERFVSPAARVEHSVDRRVHRDDPLVVEEVQHLLLQEDLDMAADRFDEVDRDVRPLDG